MTKRTSLALALALTLVLAHGAPAQTVNATDISKLVGNSSGLVGTTAILVVPRMLGGTTGTGGTAASSYPGVPLHWETAFIANASATATIECGFSIGVTVNGAAGFVIPPASSYLWPLGTVPKNQPIYCIASAASTPFDASVGAQ